MAFVNRKADFEVGSTPASALGQLRGGSHRPTVYDVAKAVGVSATTVSRALNGGSCSAATREAVVKAARKLGYQPNAAARALASRKRSRTPESGAATRTGDASTSVPQMWQSYAEMMLKLVGAQA